MPSNILRNLIFAGAASLSLTAHASNTRLAPRSNATAWR